ncbi:hypothetical protein SAMN04488030_0298 [Aliiroseovarius halocynthiae]|uniref:HEAT repeat domain-containing protein n=1 Tax=Aliiroseovarius halocynthiae TaxID=985055 RepID=A0A545SYH8_9RHOB|nr:hypothetical protein [Aliiroseovarius halocynthiae]TQV70018.1 hypothetical protein FIL88_01200 [Aliiroseovarius halocynthiae]SMR70686.1 hypothetical protein SAMN04488030_0298 [Aliiroseovarius halocynthiae]
MRIWPLLLAVVWFMALPAQARNIAVRSGEHKGFTRLVIYTKPSDTYVVEDTGGGYLLSITSDPGDFNLSRAFELIDRDRIKDLTVIETGTLAIHQGCDCHIKEFRLPTGQLVLDIVDGPDPNGSHAQAALQHIGNGRLDASKLRASLPLFTAPISHEEPISDDRTETTAQNHKGTQLVPSQNHSAIDGRALLEQLSQAASQGLVDADIELPEIKEIVAPLPSETAIDTAPQLPTTPDQHVRMQTAIDQARSDQNGGREIASTEQACLPDEQFDIASWGIYKSETDAPVFETSNYLGEFDQPDADLLVSHIRRMIYLTLGLEALQLIDSYGDDLPDAGILRMMAEVIENGEASSFTIWSPQIMCNTRGALWSALAQPKLPDRVNIQAVLRSFSELPPHLRKYLAPTLARKFLNASRVETAIEIRNIAKRSIRAVPDDTTVLDADISLAQGLSDQAHQELSDTIQSSLSETKPAIAALIQSKLQTGDGISDTELSLLASIAFEYKGNEEGPELQRLHIRSLFHMGRFSQAFSLMDLSSKGTPTPSLLADAARYLVSVGSDAEFLTHGLTREDWDTLPAKPKLAMAHRMKSLGFTEQARRLVLSNDDVPNRATREFLAEIALEQNKPNVAIGYLSGLNNESASSLRRIAMGRTAATAVTTVGRTQNMQYNLNLSGSAVSKEIQTLLSTTPEISETDAGTDLQTYQNILDSSGETRAALDELLSIVPAITELR